MIHMLRKHQTARRSYCQPADRQTVCNARCHDL